MESENETTAAAAEATPVAEKVPAPTPGELSQKAFSISQRLSSQIHTVLQMDNAKEDTSDEKKLIAKTRAALNAVCDTAGM